MPYSPVTWVDGTTPADQGNMNHIEGGVSGAYTQLESITANDGITLPSSDGPFTLANFISYLSRVIRNITGKANWYDTPDATIASLNTGLAGKLSTSGTAADSSKLGGSVAANFPQRGANNAVAGFTVSFGDGPPVSLAANEIYIQRT